MRRTVEAVATTMPSLAIDAASADSTRGHFRSNKTLWQSSFVVPISHTAIRHYLSKQDEDSLREQLPTKHQTNVMFAKEATLLCPKVSGHDSLNLTSLVNQSRDATSSSCQQARAFRPGVVPVDTSEQQPHSLQIRPSRRPPPSAVEKNARENKNILSWGKATSLAGTVVVEPVAHQRYTVTGKVGELPPLDTPPLATKRPQPVAGKPASELDCSMESALVAPPTAESRRSPRAHSLNSQRRRWIAPIAEPASPRDPVWPCSKSVKASTWNRWLENSS